MNLQEIRQQVLESEDINKLRVLELDLTQMAGGLYKAVQLAETTIEQIERKGDLSMVNTLIGICRDRQAEIKDIGGRLNYCFRMAAKAMLESKTYNEINEKAKQPRQQTKQETAFLKNNKIA